MTRLPPSGKNQTSEDESVSWWSCQEVESGHIASWQNWNLINSCNHSGVNHSDVRATLTICHLHFSRTESESISLVQDTSAGWLVVRFASCNNKFDAVQGIVGAYPIADLRQCHAYKIKQATESVIHEFCQPSHKMPCSTKGQFLGKLVFLSVSFQLLTFEIVKSIICFIHVHLSLAGCLLRAKYPKAVSILQTRTEALAADGAKDEQLALVPCWIDFKLPCIFNSAGQWAYCVVIIVISCCQHFTTCKDVPRLLWVVLQWPIQMDFSLTSNCVFKI